MKLHKVKSEPLKQLVGEGRNEKYVRECTELHLANQGETCCRLEEKARSFWSRLEAPSPRRTVFLEPSRLRARVLTRFFFACFLFFSR